MDHSHRISTSRLAVPETQATALERVNSDLDDIGRELQKAVIRLGCLHERLVGPTCTDSVKGDTDDEPKPSCLVDRLSSSVVTLRGLTLKLTMLAGKLERVA